jgi:hypothetical protein
MSFAEKSKELIAAIIALAASQPYRNGRIGFERQNDVK